MDRDKLNDAAEKYFKEESAFRPPCLCKGFVLDAFLAGALWLMTQPLADRLTDEEKEKIKQTYESLCRKISNTELPSDYIDCATAQMLLLESIFGKELFNEK